MTQDLVAEEPVAVEAEEDLDEVAVAHLVIVVNREVTESHEVIDQTEAKAAVIVVTDLIAEKVAASVGNDLTVEKAVVVSVESAQNVAKAVAIVTVANEAKGQNAVKVAIVHNAKIDRVDHRLLLVTVQDVVAVSSVAKTASLRQRYVMLKIVVKEFV